MCSVYINLKLSIFFGTGVHLGYSSTLLGLLDYSRPICYSFDSTNHTSMTTLVSIEPQLAHQLVLLHISICRVYLLSNIWDNGDE